jgi:Hemerythrin HHE cation binding domain
MSRSSVPDDSRSNHREHEVLRLEIENMRAALDSLAAYSEAIANLRSLGEVAEHLRLLLSDISAHFVHEERTILAAIERLGPDEARFAELMREQHQMLGSGLANFFQRLNEIHDSNDFAPVCASCRSLARTSPNCFSITWRPKIVVSTRSPARMRPPSRIGKLRFYCFVPPSPCACGAVTPTMLLLRSVFAFHTDPLSLPTPPCCCATISAAAWRLAMAPASLLCPASDAFCRFVRLSVPVV